MEEIFAEEFVTAKNISNRRRLNNFNKRERELQLQKRLIISVIAIAVFVLIAFVLVQGVKASTESNKRTKTFSSVEVKPGDTVWSIANEYMSDEYTDVNELVNEIEKTNHISANSITAGSYIIVPYYTASK